MSWAYKVPENEPEEERDIEDEIPYNVLENLEEWPPTEVDEQTMQILRDRNLAREKDLYKDWEKEHLT